MRALGRANLPALAPAVPPLAGLILLVAIVFGPTAMRPIDIAEATAGSAPVRVGLWAAWLAAFTPAAVALRRVDTSYFRWLPIAPGAFWLSWLVFLIAINLPIAALWAGASVAQASAVLVACVAFHGAILVRGPLALVLVAAAFAAIATPSSPGLVTAGVGAVVLAAALPLAWSRGLVKRKRVAPVPRGGPTRALVIAIGSGVVDPMIPVRTLVAAIVFGGLGGLLVAGEDWGWAWTLRMSGAAAALGAIGLSASLAHRATRGWRELRWLLRSSATSASSQALALIAIVGLLCGLVGAVVAATTAVIGGSSVALIALSATLGFGFGSLVGIASVAAATRVGMERTIDVWMVSTAVAIVFGLLILAAGLGALAVVPAAIILCAVYVRDAALREIEV